MPDPINNAPAPQNSATGKPVEAPKEAPKAAPAQTVELELNGQKVQLTAQQILALQEKAKQFDMTAKQKAELEKGVAALLEQLDNDPIGLYERRGKDAKAFIVQRFKKIVEEEAQDPATRELLALRSEKAEREKRDAEAKQSEEQKAKAERQKAMYVQTLKEIDAALTEKGLPKDHYTLDRTLRLMAAGKRARGKNFSAKEAVEILEKEEMNHVGFIAKKLPSEKLKALFGADIIKKLNSEDVAKLKQADEKAIKDAKAAAPSEDKSKVDSTMRKKMRNNYAGV